MQQNCIQLDPLSKLLIHLFQKLTKKAKIKKFWVIFQAMYLLSRISADKITPFGLTFEVT